MKNIFLGIIGLFITVYLVIFGLDVYEIQTEKNRLEQLVSHAVEKALGSQYLVGEEEQVKGLLEDEISASISHEDRVEVEVLGVDLEKGALSVCVTEQIKLLTGGVKTICVEKTAIVERIETQSQKVQVSFLVDGEVYKIYTLVKGEICPMPKVPSDVFVGWMEYGAETQGVVENIGAVYEDKVFLAVTE